MQYHSFETKHFEVADDLWEALSPTREHELTKAPSKLVYRGQADANWQLVPSVLRPTLLKNWRGDQLKADDQIFTELHLLECFADFCDQIGVRLPNDSPSFRREHLSVQNFDQKYYKNPTLWPDPTILEVMALAQHHGVPTRLLDWTKIPYIAAYRVQAYPHPACRVPIRQSAQSPCRHL